MASPDPRNGHQGGPNSPYSPTTRRSPLNINTSHVAALPQRAGGNRFSYVETPVEMQEPQYGVQQRYAPLESPIGESQTPVSATVPSGNAQQAHTQQAEQVEQEQQRDDLPRLSQQVYIMPTRQSYAAQQQYSPPIQHQGQTSTHRTSSSSPYNIPQPQQTHPAYYAPISDPTTASNPRSRPGSAQPQPTSPRPQQATFESPQKPQRTSSIPIHGATDEYSTFKQPLSPTRPLHSPSQPKPDPTYVPHAHSPSLFATHRSHTSPTQPVFSPTSLAGPNGVAPDLHNPGQIVHPNMQFPKGDGAGTGTKEDWQHGLCECGGDVGTCFTGVVCPCILDSKTAYRLERKSSKKDPSDLLGFGSCNGRCGVMALFGVCGLFCKQFPPPSYNPAQLCPHHTLSPIPPLTTRPATGIFPSTIRTRIRHTYHLSGNIGTDILHSCCCCCCVAIQNEREVRGREDKLRQNAGPAQTQTQYRAGVGEMSYVAGGGS
jgi:Cys-rich protein (TIGR01571 family)